jgi:Mg/Co/Ni transporter MgtE
MSLFDRIFRGGAKKSPARAAVSIEALIAEVGAASIELEGNPGAIEPALIVARFQDALRSRGIRPLPAAAVAELVAGMDQEARMRLSILAALAEGPALAEALSAFGEEAGEAITRECVVRTVEVKRALSLELVRQSPVRAEELARAFVLSLGVAIQGETPAVSRERAERIDYSKLLEEAERAKQSAEARTEEIRKLQETQAMLRARGKW